jgi:predicted  nucleic acid-binding Zn-ribbon protein
MISYFFTLLQLDDSALLMQQKIAEREEKLKKESQKKDDALIDARRRADDLTRSIADLEEELSSVNGRMAQYESGSYMLADAVREVKDLKIRVRSTEDKLVVRTQQVNRLEETVEALHDELELMRAKFGIPAESKLDLSGLKVKRALELERLKSVNTQLERDIEQLENERYELHQELRHAAMRRADIAMQVGLSAEDLQKLESFSDYLKSGGRAGAPAEMSESGDPSTVQRKVKVLTNRLEESKREASEQRALAEECSQQNDALKKELELMTKDKEVKERAFFKEISDKIDSMFSNQRLVGNVSVIPTTPARQAATSASSQQNIVHVHSGQALTADVIQDIVAQAVRQFSGSLPSFTSAPAPSDTSALSIEAVRKQVINVSIFSIVVATTNAFFSS